MTTIVGCSAILHKTDETASVLVAMRSHRKPSHQGQWEYIGGKMEAGEQPFDCICREVLEEIGCQLKDPVLSHVCVDYRDGKRFVVFNYEGTIDQEPRPNLEEVGQLKWISAEEIDRMEWVPGCKAELLRYFAGLTCRDRKSLDT